MSDSQELTKLKRENKRLRALLAEAVSLLNRYKHLIANRASASSGVRKAAARSKRKTVRARKTRG